MKNWLEEIEQNAGNEVKKMLVGNKSDLKSQRVVDFETGKQLADKLEIPFIETSALDASNVSEAFKVMAMQIYKSGIVTSRTPINTPTVTTTSSGCCG